MSGSELAMCRVSDGGVGTCPLHGPTPLAYSTLFSNGADSVLVNSLPGCNLLTIGIASCGHPTIVISGSETGLLEGTGSHRVSDAGTNTGGYLAVEGSPNAGAG